MASLRAQIPSVIREGGGLLAGGSGFTNGLAASTERLLASLRRISDASERGLRVMWNKAVEEDPMRRSALRRSALREHGLAPLAEA